MYANAKFASKEKLGLKYDFIGGREIIITDYTYLKSNKIYDLWNDNTKTHLFLNKNSYYIDDLLQLFNQYELDLYNISNYICTILFKLYYN